MSKKKQCVVHFGSIVKASKFNRVHEIRHVRDVLLDEYVCVVVSCKGGDRQGDSGFEGRIVAVVGHASLTKLFVWSWVVAGGSCE